MQNQYWITAVSFDNSQYVTMRVDAEEWEFDDNAIKTIVNPLINGEAKEVWANGWMYQLA